MKFDWKEFLKPTLPKLAITILLVYFFVPMVAIPSSLIICKGMNCGSGSSKLLTLFESQFNGSYITLASINYFLLIMGSAINYLISCVLVKTGSWLLSKTPHQ